MIADQRKYLLPSDEDSSVVSAQYYEPTVNQNRQKRSLGGDPTRVLGHPD